MTEFKVGEIVDITIKGARVVNDYGTHRGNLDGSYDDTGRVLVVPLDSARKDDRSVAVNLATPGVTVERVAPAEWPPRPGDLWHDRLGIAWFGVLKDGDLLLSNSNLTRHHPADVNTQFGPLTLVHREGGDES